MNNDRISRTPGGESMLQGGILLALGFIAWLGLRYELGSLGKGVIILIMAFGALQLLHGLVKWKYTDREIFAAQQRKHNLLIDVPILENDKGDLHRIEDALIEQIRNAKTIEIEIHSIDTANNVGTVHLIGRNADAMFAQIYATLARFAKQGGLNLFPPQGQDIDPEIWGKRVYVVMNNREYG